MAQQRSDMHEELNRGLMAELAQLKELLGRKEHELRAAAERNAQARQQVGRRVA